MAQTQLMLFIVYCIAGIAISLLFDFFRSLRKNITTSNTLTYIEDFLFVLISAIIIIYIILKFSFGELRFYTFLGMIIGIVIYFYLISKYILKINNYVLKFLKSIVKFALRIFARPFRFVTINLKRFRIRFDNIKVIKKKASKD